MKLTKLDYSFIVKKHNELVTSGYGGVGTITQFFEFLSDNKYQLPTYNAIRFGHLATDVSKFFELELRKTKQPVQTVLVSVNTYSFPLLMALYLWLDNNGY
jgi:hypothetical protein